MSERTNAIHETMRTKVAIASHCAQRLSEAGFTGLVFQLVRGRTDCREELWHLQTLILRTWLEYQVDDDGQPAGVEVCRVDYPNGRPAGYPDTSRPREDSN